MIDLVKPLFVGLGLETKGDKNRWCVTSPDDRFRYVLADLWDDRLASMHLPLTGELAPAVPLWIWCMLNPSKARHDKPDPTFRKCVGFAERGGAGGILIVNLLAYSATDPRDMVSAWSNGLDVAGEHNDVVLRWAHALDHFPTAGLTTRRIAAWGKIPKKLQGRTDRAGRDWQRGAGGAYAHCLGQNGDGSPRHPLMLGYKTPIVPIGHVG